MRNRLEYLKRQNRRRLLLKELSSHLSSLSMDSFLPQTESDEICENIFKKSNEATKYTKYGNGTYENDIPLSIEYLKMLYKTKRLLFDNSYLMFSKEFECEFLQIDIDDIFDNLEFLLSHTGWQMDQGDFIIIEKDLSKYIFTIITEHCTEVYLSLEDEKNSLVPPLSSYTSP